MPVREGRTGPARPPAARRACWAARRRT